MKMERWLQRDMDNEIVVYLKKKQKFGCENFRNYAALVADLELVPEQYDSIFKNMNSKQEYGCLWEEMEIINAIALNEWEELGRNSNFNFIWGKKYKQDAEQMLRRLVNFLQNLEDE